MSSRSKAGPGTTQAVEKHQRPGWGAVLVYTHVKREERAATTIAPRGVEVGGADGPP